MAEVEASAEVHIDATPETIWDLLVDFENYPSWSKIHKKVRIESVNDEGWPERVWMQMSIVGIKDEQVIDHFWTEDSVSWQLATPTKVQRAQRGTYSVAPNGTGSHCRLEGAIDLIIPIPSMVIRQGQKLVLGIATKGVKAEAEKLRRAQG